MSKKSISHIARIQIIVLLLIQLSVLFPMFEILPFASKVDAAILTAPQIASFDNQKWLIDEILRQVRLTRPTVANISQVTTEDLATITVINLNGVSVTGASVRSRWVYSSWNWTSY